MRKSIFVQLSLLVFLIIPSFTCAKGFKKYSEEVSHAQAMLDCTEERDIPATKSFGALYICTLGKAKTAKWFITEKPETGRVRSIGLMWVDWQVDAGYGIRADWQEVEAALELLIGRYVPTRQNDLRKAFWDSHNEDFSTSDFMIYYTFKAGLQKDERIVVIEEK